MTGKLYNLVLLCNDVNLKTLLGVTMYDDHHLLITCKSFVKRFNIEDRKQVNSWITKSWHPFTSSAIKDPTYNKLYAVINNVNLCCWLIDKEEIEVSKKDVFMTSINSLISTSKFIYVVYSSGFIEKLDNALKNRKEAKPKIVNEEDEILDVQILKRELIAALLVRNKDKDLILYRISIGSNKKIQTHLLNLEGHILTGYSILSIGHLITTWSDGHLYSYDIMGDKISNQLLPGIVKGQLDVLNSKKRIKVLELSSNYLILQGMNASEEGGILVLWDYKFGVPVSTKPLKMYRDPPLAWKVQKGAVVTDGGSLVYARADLSPSSIASMVGSRISDRSFTQEDSVIGLCVSSDSTVNEIPLAATKTVLSNKSIDLADAIQKVNYAGVSEDVLLKLLIPHLIEKKNEKLLKECLTAFKFMPEKCIISILNFFLHLPDDVSPGSECVVALSKDITKIKNLKSKRKSKASSAVGQEVEENNKDNLDSSLLNTTTCTEGREKVAPTSPFSTYKSSLINEVLSVSFTDNELSHHIRSLDFSTSLDLLKYLHYLLVSGKALSQESNSSCTYPSVEKTSLWMSFLLDANYHQFIMTSEVDIQKQLLSCFNDVITLYNITEASHSIEVLIERVLASKPLPLSQNDLPYSIETIIL